MTSRGGPMVGRSKHPAEIREDKIICVNYEGENTETNKKYLRK